LNDRPSGEVVISETPQIEKITTSQIEKITTRMARFTYTG
jgi:hypothetical protein